MPNRAALLNMPVAAVPLLFEMQRRAQPKGGVRINTATRKQPLEKWQPEMSAPLPG